MNATDGWSIISVLFGVLVLSYVRRAQSLGKILGQLSFIERSEHPRLFKFYTILYLLIAAACIIVPPILKFVVFAK